MTPATAFAQGSAGGAYSESMPTLEEWIAASFAGGATTFDTGETGNETSDETDPVGDDVGGSQSETPSVPPNGGATGDTTGTGDETGSVGDDVGGSQSETPSVPPNGDDTGETDAETGETDEETGETGEETAETDEEIGETADENEAPAAPTATIDFASSHTDGFLAEIGEPVKNSIAITSVADLRKIGSDPAYPLDGRYHLTQNLDLSGGNWYSNIWEGQPFTGVFDGQGKIISNLTYSDENYYFGLFNCTEGASIVNLGLEDVDIDINRDYDSYAGALVGYAVETVIANCYVTGRVSVATGDWAHAGGLVGRAEDIAISASYNTATVTAAGASRAHAGGLVGHSEDGGLTISKSYNTGATSATVSNTYNEAGAGGLVGYVSAYSYAVAISDCYNTGAASASGGGYAYAGGIASYVSSSSATVSACYSTGNVAASGGDYNSYAGAIIGSGSISTFENCYWNNEASQTVEGSPQDPKRPNGNNSYNTAGGLTLAEMQDEAKFTGFDFDNTWQIDGATPYKLPTLQKAAAIALPAIESVGTQSGSLTMGTAGEATFAITTENIADGDHEAVVLGLPQGVTVKDGKVTISDGSGTLTLASGTAARAGIYAGLQLALAGATSAPFTLTIGRPATPPAPTGRFLAPIVDVTTLADFDEYIEIKEVDDLKKIGDSSHSSTHPLNGKYYLSADLDLSGEEWTPIDGYPYFSGIFDGQGHVITGLTVSGDYSNAGLFGRTDNGAVIRNVGIEGGAVSPSSSYGYGGALVGYAQRTAISNCYNTGLVSISGYYAGGLVGYAGSSTTISDCFNTGDVTATYDSSVSAGGIAGQAYSSTAISNCYNTGAVSASGNYTRVGGITGQASSSSPISNCYNTGAVNAAGSGDTYAGGIVGQVYSSSPIGNCYNTGGISAVSSGSGDYISVYAGGIAGYADTSPIRCCYSTGAASAAGGDYDPRVGGIVGAAWSSGNTSPLTFCYWDNSAAQTANGQAQNPKRANGNDSSSTGGGLTAAAMQSQASFDGFDFAYTWDMPPSSEDYSYPVLYGFPVPRLVSITAVGAQTGQLSARSSGTVTYAVTTKNFEDGTYSATVANLPKGVAVAGSVTIAGNSGTLTLAGNTGTVDGTYEGLRLTLAGAASPSFTLKIDPSDPASNPYSEVAVGGLKAEALNPFAVELSWTAPAGETAPTRYEVWRSDQYTKGETQLSGTVSGPNDSGLYSFTDDSIPTSGWIYIYKVRPVWEVGGTGHAGKDTEARVKTPVQTPAKPTIATTPNTVTISWKTLPSADGYEVYLSGFGVTKFNNKGEFLSGGASGTAVVSGNTFTATLTGLSPNKAYYALVRAYWDTASGSRSGGYSPVVSRATTGPAPGKPSLTASTTTSATLAWGAAGGSPNGYVVYRNGAEVGITTAEARTYTDSGLAPGTAYRYTVRAYWGAAVSAINDTNTRYKVGAPSPALAFTPSAPVPGNLQLVAFPTSIEASWNALPDADGFAGYNVYVDGALNQTVAKGSTVATIGGLTPINTYRVQVAGVWGTGESEVTGPRTAVKSARTTGPAPKLLTSGATRSTITPVSATLVWTEVNAGADHAPSGYAIYRDGYYIGKATSPDPLTLYTDNSVRPGVTYRYTVRAYWDVDLAPGTEPKKTGQVSNAWQAKAPGGAVALQDGGKTATSIKVTWNAVSDLTEATVSGYYIYLYDTYVPSYYDADGNWVSGYSAPSQSKTVSAADPLEAVFENLYPNTTYWVSAYPLWQVPGETEPRYGAYASRNITTAGPAPTLRTAAATTAGGIASATNVTLTWTAPTGAAPAITGYRIRRWHYVYDWFNGRYQWGWAVLRCFDVYDPAATTYTDDTALPATKYRYDVQALWNTAESGTPKPGKASAVRNVTTPGPAPINFKVAAPLGANVLTWGLAENNPSAKALKDEVVGFRVTKTVNHTPSYSSSSTYDLGKVYTWTDNDMNPGGTVSYQIQSLWQTKKNGNQPGLITKGQKSPTPFGPAPGGVKATVVSPTSATVSWNELAETAAVSGSTTKARLIGYNVGLHRVVGKTLYSAGTRYVAKDDTRFVTFANLSPANQYQVRVAGVWEHESWEGQGEGKANNPARFRTGGSAPSGLAVVANTLTGSSVQLTWKPVNHPDVTGYYVYEYYNSGGNWYYNGITSVSASDFHRSGYTWTDTNNSRVRPGVTVRYAVRTVYNYSYYSPYSAARAVTPPGAAPTGIAAVSNSGTSLTVAWNAPPAVLGAAVTGYRVQLFRTYSGGYRSSVTSVFNTSESRYTFTGLQPNTTYQVLVTPVWTGSRNGRPSNYVNVKTGW
jgi:hypothetical protein